MNLVKEKIKSKNILFESIINKANYNNNKNIENILKNIIDEKKLEEIKNEIKKIKNK